MRKYKHLPPELEDAEDALLRLSFGFVLYKARLLWWIDALTERKYTHE